MRIVRDISMAVETVQGVQTTPKLTKMIANFFGEFWRKITPIGYQSDETGFNLGWDPRKRTTSW